MFTNRCIACVALGSLPFMPHNVHGQPAESPPAAPSAVAARDIDRLVAALDSLHSYSDSGTIRQGDGTTLSGHSEMESFTFQRPNRFRIESSDQLIISDGRMLTTVRKRMRRYVIEPLPENWRSGLRVNRGPRSGFTTPISQIFLAEDRKAFLADQLRGVTSRGREELEGDACIVLEGTDSSRMMDNGTTRTKWYLRERDGLLRRMETSHIYSPPQSAVDTDTDGSRTSHEFRFTTVYDVKNVTTDGDHPAEAFAFQPKRGWKKVAKFYDRWPAEGEYAYQIAMSGKVLPPLNLVSPTGTQVSSETIAGKVAILVFLPGPPRGLPDAHTEFEEGIQQQAEQFLRGIPEGEVTTLFILDADAASPLAQALAGGDGSPLVALDPDGKFRDLFFDNEWSPGIILVDKDLVVQGATHLGCGGDVSAGLKSDIAQLVAGQALPAAVPMGEEEIREMQNQQRMMFSGVDAEVDALNEDRLVRAWSIRTRSSFSFSSFGGHRSDPTGEALWIRDDRSLRRVSPRGEVVEVLPLGTTSRWQTSASEIAIANLASGRATISLEDEPIVSQVGEVTHFGPGNAVLRARDEQGEILWELKLGQTRGSSNLMTADMDARAGDEVAFVQDGALCILDGLGQWLVRMPLDGQTSWIRIQDLDADRRAEVYIRYSNSLDRYDYDARR